MNKKTFQILSVLMFSLILFSGISSAATKITSIPDQYSSFEEWKNSVIEANAAKGFFSVSAGNTWGTCENDCSDLAPFIGQGDCTACPTGSIESSCTWHEDSMSSLNYFNSADEYCSQIFKVYDYYNKQCYCTYPTVQCSGGADVGDRKCQGDEVWECMSGGVWEYASQCTYGCSSGSCDSQSCESHDEKRCSGNSVYWYDSCGEKEEEYLRCDNDEECNDGECERVCDEQFIGPKVCQGSNLMQQYQTADCNSDLQLVEECAFGCENSQCKNPNCPTCLEPTFWSQCVDGEMQRTNYKCDGTTDYQCTAYTESSTCDCSSESECGYDEVCSSNVCETLSCGENEIADNHECVKVSGLDSTTLLFIIIGVLVFLLIMAFVIILLKGGKK